MQKASAGEHTANAGRVRHVYALTYAIYALACAQRVKQVVCLKRCRLCMYLCQITCTCVCAHVHSLHSPPLKTKSIYVCDNQFHHYTIIPIVDKAICMLLMKYPFPVTIQQLVVPISHRPPYACSICSSTLLRWYVILSAALSSLYIYSHDSCSTCL